MKFRIYSVATAFFAAMALATSCSDSTDAIGSSISDVVDPVSVETASFDIESRSILADSVLSRATTGSIGKVRDPETGAYVTGDFMAQFYCLENFQFPEKSKLVTYDEEGNVKKDIVQADSCELRLFYSSFYGDSTSTQKLTAYEMSKPMNEDKNYYSNFDPMAKGYIRDIREDGIHKDKVYALTDFNVAKNERDTSTYEPYITIKLNDPYIDKDGKKYNNYGTYVMQKYYKDPSSFKNAYTFRNNVVPGFYFKHKSGLGNMAYIDASQLNIYYKYVNADTVATALDVFWGTEEVLQTTNYTNDKATLQKLADEDNCTYLKTPAGIFTEVTLPIEDIMRNHESDNIAGASLSFQRINSTSENKYNFGAPQTVLLIPKDSLYSFFENQEVYNNRTSYVTTLSTSASTTSSGNCYTFSNISGIITAMAAIDKSSRSRDWNKAVIIPVTVTTTSTSTSSNYSSYYYYYYGSSSSSSSSTTPAKVAHDMTLKSTKLVKGTKSDSPIKLEVIYSKFK